MSNTQTASDIQAVRRGLLLGEIPLPRRTAAVCLAAVRKDGENLEFVPGAATYDEAGDRREAVCGQGEVPPVITEELCLEALTHAVHFAAMWIPARLWSPELAMAAAHHDGDLSFIPEELRTVEVCTAAAHCLTDDTRGIIAEMWWECVPAAIRAEVERVTEADHEN